MITYNFDAATILRIKKELRLLITSEAVTVREQELKNIMAAVDHLGEAEDSDAALSDLLLSLLDYPVSRQYLIAETREDRDEVRSQISVAVTADINVVEILTNLALTFTDSANENSSNRTAVLNRATLSGHTVKFSNIRLSPPKILKIISIMVPGALGLSNPKEPLLFIGSLLALVIGATLEITDNLKVELDDDLTSVFLGCVAAQAKSVEKPATELAGLQSHEITKMANKYRREVGVPPLNEKEVVRNLHRLQTLHCVSQRDKLWQVVERVEVRK